MNELFSYYGLIINNILYILASKRIVRYKVYKFMIIRFIVDNFLSFDKETEFNMIAGNFKIHQNHVYKYGKIDILKSSAVYGANASGKSNLIKAIFTMQQIIKKGKINKSIKTEKFKLNPENISKPTIFEIEIVVDKHFYNYGFSFENDIITEEWLYETGASKPKMIFTRELLKNGQLSIHLAKKYSNSDKFKLLIKLLEENLVQRNQLLLSKYKEINIPIISKIRFWLENKLIIIFPNSTFGAFIPFLEDDEVFNKFTNNIIKTFDTGVQQLCVEKIESEEFESLVQVGKKEDIFNQLKNRTFVNIKTPNGWFWISKLSDKINIKRLISKHINNESDYISFDITNESDGTQRILDFIPAFHLILKDNVTFIIDEIDQSLHPNLLLTIIKKILSEDTKGQLIFTTHESNILDLDIFRQDEIWFCEKNTKTGSTELYSLADYKPRYDLDIKKGYLIGRFGAIPFLADLESLNWGC